MRRSLVILAAAALISCLAAGAAERRPAPPAQTTCPISGKPVDGRNYADVDGFRVLTAGPAETEEVRKNPGKAFAALAKNKQAASPTVMVCPSMQQAVGPQYPYVQQAGKRIYYCCAPCKPRIQKDFKGASAMMKKLAEGAPRR